MSSIFVVIYTYSLIEKQTKNGRQYTSFCAAVHLVWPFCIVNVSRHICHNVAIGFMNVYLTDDWELPWHFTKQNSILCILRGKGNSNQQYCMFTQNYNFLIKSVPTQNIVAHLMFNKIKDFIAIFKLNKIKLAL